MGPFCSLRFNDESRSFDHATLGHGARERTCVGRGSVRHPRVGLLRRGCVEVSEPEREDPPTGRCAETHHTRPSMLPATTSVKPPNRVLSIEARKRHGLRASLAHPGTRSAACSSSANVRMRPPWPSCTVGQSGRCPRRRSTSSPACSAATSSPLPSCSSARAARCTHAGPAERHALNAAFHAAGAETGFWDDDGRPAPWPDGIGERAPETNRPIPNDRSAVIGGMRSVVSDRSVSTDSWFADPSSLGGVARLWPCVFRR
jgi:hypothetical protein